MKTKLSFLFAFICVANMAFATAFDDALLSSNSKPLSFTNDSYYPWTAQNGYVQNSNYSAKGSQSQFSTNFVIDSLSYLTFDVRVGSTSDRHVFVFKVNGNEYLRYNSSTDWYTVSVVLEPGIYTVSWHDMILDEDYSSTSLTTRVRNVELSSKWTEVNCVTAGSLGSQTLLLDNSLSDVKLLKVSGRLNTADWTTISNMSNLMGIDLSATNITSVPNKGFDNLTKLSYVNFPSTLTSIGSYAFRGTQINHIDAPASLMSIGEYAFASTPIRHCNFSGNSQLTTVEAYAFYRCKFLDEFIMPNSLIEVGGSSGSVFYGCESLRKIVFSNNLSIISQGLCKNCTNLQEVYLPANLIEIKGSAFSGDTLLHSISFPQSLRRIGDYAFYECGLDSIILPTRLSLIGNFTFSYCERCTYIELPSAVSFYGYDEDYNYNGDYAFTDIPSLRKVVCRAATPPTVVDDPFLDGNSRANMTLVVPSFSIASYKLDSYWSKFGSIESGAESDYWAIGGTLDLSNNRRLTGESPDVDILQGGKLLVAGNAPFSVNQLTLNVSRENPACLQNACDNFTANSIVTKYPIEGNEWYFLSPLYDVNISDIHVSNSAAYVFRYYDAATRASSGTGNSWKNVTTPVLYAGTGYIFQANKDCEIVLPARSGEENAFFSTATRSITLASHNSSDIEDKNWNFVANPYPCYYDIYYMDYTAPITIWDSENYTYRAYSVIDDEVALKPMQPFFLQQPDNINSVSFSQEGCQLTPTINHQLEAPRRVAGENNRQVYSISLSDGEHSDYTRVVINENSSEGYELERDASKFLSTNANIPQIYSFDSNKRKYAINELPNINGFVELGCYLPTSGSYTINLLRGNQEVYLVDSIANQTVDLSLQDYSFSASAGTIRNRFYLRMKSPGITTSVDNISGTSRVSVVDGGIVVDASGTSLVKVYSISGVLLYNSIAGFDNEYLSLNNGVYLVQIDDYTQKVYVK